MKGIGEVAGIAETIERLGDFAAAARHTELARWAERLLEEAEIMSKMAQENKDIDSGVAGWRRRVNDFLKKEREIDPSSTLFGDLDRIERLRDAIRRTKQVRVESGEAISSEGVEQLKARSERDLDHIVEDIVSGSSDIGKRLSDISRIESFWSSQAR